MPDLTVAIYSYNRGPWLAVCLASVQAHIPWAQVIVVDDGSDDPETSARLGALPPGVALRRAGQGTAARHGGLYANMQDTLALCETPYLLSLQDDTQITRPFTETELATCAAALEKTGAAFISPLFAQGRGGARGARSTPVPGTRFFTQMNSRPLRPVPLAYRDISLADVARLRAVAWRYQARETASAAAARAAFGPMLMAAEPFVAFLPEVPAFRGRKLTLGARLAEARLGRAVKPFRPMSAEALARLAAHPTAPAEAQHFLQPEDPAVRAPFEPNAVEVLWWTRALHRAEVKLRRWLRRG